MWVAVPVGDGGLKHCLPDCWWGWRCSILGYAYHDGSVITESTITCPFCGMSKNGDDANRRLPIFL